MFFLKLVKTLTAVVVNITYVSRYDSIEFRHSRFISTQIRVPAKR